MRSIRFAITMGFMLLVASCGQQLVDPPFEKDDLQFDSFQMRYSERGLAKMGDAMEAQMPQDPQAQEIPPQCDIEVGFGITMDVCGTGSSDDCQPEDPPCTLGTKIDSFTLRTEDGSLLMVFDTTIWTDNPLTIHAPATDCTVDIDTTRGAHPYVPVTIPIAMTIDPVSDRTIFTVGDVVVDSGAIDDEDIDIQGSLTCKAVEYLFEGMIVDSLASMMADQIGQQIQASLCRPCDYGCPHDATCAEDTGLCMEASGEGCVSNFGGEYSMPLMGYGSPALESHHWAGGYIGTEVAGLSMGFDAAYRSSFREGCTPIAPPPAQTFTPYSPTVAQDQSPFGSDYDAAMVLTIPYLTSFGYAMYESGLLCWDFSANQQYGFDTSTLATALPSLNEITHGRVEPMTMTFIPQKPPVFSFGEGRWHMDGENVVVESPHILMTEPEMAIDFWVWLDGAKVKLVRYLATVDIPLVLIPSGSSIRIVSGGLQISDIRVVDSEMVREPEASLIMLMDYFARNVQNQSFDMGEMPLPQMMGFNFSVKEGGIVPVDDASYLAIYMDMTAVPDATDASSQSVGWTALLLPLLLLMGAPRRRRSLALVMALVALVVLGGCKSHRSGILGGDCGGEPAPLLCRDATPQCVPGQRLAGVEEPRWSLWCTPVPVECQCVPDSSPLSPGEITWNARLATDGTRILLVAREESFGDLVYAWISDDSTPQWAVLDGAPDGPVIAPPDTYRGGVAEPGPDDGYTTYAAHVAGTFFVSHSTSEGEVRISYLAEDGWHSVRIFNVTEGDARILATAVGAYDEGKGGWPRIVWSVFLPGKKGVVYMARAAKTPPLQPDDFSITEIATADTTDTGRVGLPAVPGIHIRAVGHGFTYYDGAKRRLVYFEPGLGEVPITPEGAAEGMFAGGCLEEDGTTTFYYVGEGKLKQRTMAADGTLGEPQVIDDGIRDDGRHVLGNYLTVVCQPRMLLFQDGLTRNLVRLRQVSGVWARKEYPRTSAGDAFGLDAVMGAGKLIWIHRIAAKAQGQYWKLAIGLEEVK